MKLDMTFPDQPFAYYERLTLENFTAFSRATFEFVPGINVLIGENGTGKTHVMKAMYAWQRARDIAKEDQPADYGSSYRDTFRVASLGDLQRLLGSVATVSGTFGGDEWGVRLKRDSGANMGARPGPSRPIFIPAIDLMAHTRNFTGILRDYADFDQTCFDFVSNVTAQSPSLIASSELPRVPDLSALVSADVEWEPQEQRFYLTDERRRLSFALVAEGVRKVVALERLIRLGWIVPGSILFWDEPEVNVNPKWMKAIISVLIQLAGNGVQVFLATHDYVILKEIELVLRGRALTPTARTDDWPISTHAYLTGQLESTATSRVPLRFFSLRKVRDASKVTWADNFAELEPNPILDQFDEMLAEDWRLSDQEAAG